MIPFAFRPYRPGDEQAINHAFNQVFRKARTLAEWRWKFLSTLGGPYVMLAVDPAEQVLAQYAAVPVRFQTPVGEVLAGHVVDVFSLPHARGGLAAGKAYLQAMAAFIERWCGPGGFALCYGFPSERPLKLGQRTGPYAQIPAQPVYRFSAHLTTSSPAQLRRFRAAWGLVPTVFEELWQRHGSRYPFAGIRDAAYLRWRYNQHPRHRYEGLTLYRGEAPVAAAILRVTPEVLALVDWAAPPDPAVWRVLVAEVGRTWARGAGRTLTGWLTGDAETLAVFQHLGFDVATVPEVRLVVHVFHPDLDPASVPGAFFTTWGDTDLI